MQKRQNPLYISVNHWRLLLIESFLLKRPPIIHISQSLSNQQYHHKPDQSHKEVFLTSRLLFHFLLVIFYYIDTFTYKQAQASCTYRTLDDKPVFNWKFTVTTGITGIEFILRPPSIFLSSSVDFFSILFTKIQYSVSHMTSTRVDNEILCIAINLDISWNN